MFVLDSNVVSELRKVTSGNPLVKAWVRAQSPAAMFLSAITILEIRRGITNLQRNGDSAQAEIFERWLDRQVLPSFAQRILAVDHVIAQRAAKLPWPDPNDYRDALIGATALVHGATVVTRNVRHFEAFDVKLVNPWEE